jgi:ribosomal protein L37AE/L43A
MRTIVCGGRPERESCPACGRIDARAGATWGCHLCSKRYAGGSRWWDIEIPDPAPAAKEPENG